MQTKPSNNELSSTDLVELYFTLNQIPSFGPVKFQQLLLQCEGDLNNLSQLTQSDFKALGLSSPQISALKRPNASYIQKNVDWLNSNESHFVIGYTDPDYPDSLKEISAPPFLLFGYGNQEVIHQYQMAMVGSRNPSLSGKHAAHALAKELSDSGWVITSGLAMGIDAASHTGALDAGGVSIGVIGAGIDHVYPKRNKKLYERMIESGGCVISEFAPGVPPKPENFPRRNRIISGLSKGVVVVEAEIKSGSLISARYALEQDREVFAVPGNINNPLAKGCHYLIKQGAKLVDCVDDINEEFTNVVALHDPCDRKNIKKTSEQSLASDKLLDSVDYEATTLDVIAARSGMPVSQLLSALLEYELRGQVASVSGGYIKLGAK